MMFEVPFLAEDYLAVMQGGVCLEVVVMEHLEVVMLEDYLGQVGAMLHGEVEDYFRPHLLILEEAEDYFRPHLLILEEEEDYLMFHLLMIQAQ